MPYIDRDALIERLTRMWESRQLTNTKYKSFTEILTAEPTADVVSKDQYDIWFEHANILAEELRKYQNADVVEVVRCKDCVIHDICRYRMGLGENGFCSQGRRKDRV